jgi:hypothetical protein
MDDLTERKLQTAYELIKAGQRDQAREILIPLVRANPNLSDAWFLLGHAVSNPQEKIRYFQQVLRLDPADQAAQKQLAQLLVLQLAPKKQNPALLWGLAGLAGLFICLSGLGLWWGFNHPLFASPAPTAPGSATSILPTITLVASTLKPEPSATPKLTSRPTITLPPTSTPQPSVTILPTLTIAFTETSSLTPRPNPKVFSGCLIPISMDVPAAPFKIENFGQEKATVQIKGMSKNGNYPIYCQKIVKQGRPVFLTLMWGDYEYIVTRGTTVRSGSFFINQSYKATMRIFKDKIQIGPFP